MKYHAGVAVPTARAANAALAMIDPPASGFVSVRRIRVVNDAATACGVGLVRTLTAGTASGSQAFQAGNPAVAAHGTLLVHTWSAQPTIAGTPLWLRNELLPAVASAGLEWVFDADELYAQDGATTQLLLVNVGGAAAGALRVSATIEA